MTKLRNFLKRFFPLSSRGWLIFLVAMAVASVLCWLLGRTTSSDTHVPMIFVLAVLVVALCTDGYFYGLLAAISSVLGVNYAFTYPYLKLDFSIYGYPLTFMTMLAVGFAVSTLTTRVKAQEKLRAESEREKMRANLLRAVSHDLRTPLPTTCAPPSQPSAVPLPRYWRMGERSSPKSSSGSCCWTPSRMPTGSAVWWKICCP